VIVAGNVTAAAANQKVEICAFVRLHHVVLFPCAATVREWQPTA